MAKRNIFRNISLFYRLSMLYVSIGVIIYVFLALFIYKTEKNKIFTTSEKAMRNELKSLLNIYELENTSQLTQLKLFNNILEVIIKDKLTYFKLDTNTKTELEVLNLITKKNQTLDIYQWEFKGKPLTEIDNLFYSYSFLLNSNIALFQRTKQGLVMVNVSNKKDFLKQTPYLFFPNETHFTFKILNGDIFSGIIHFNNTAYLVIGRPFYYKGNIIGALVNFKVRNFSENFKNFFNSRVYFKKGYPFVMGEDGILYVHPYLQDQSIKNTKAYQKIIQAKYHKGYYFFKYKWPETRFGEYKYMYVKYIPEDGYYIGVTWYEKDLLEDIKQLKFFLSLAVALSSLFVFILVLAVYLALIKRLKKIEKIVDDLLEGKVPEKKEISFNDEIGIIIQKLNQLSDVFSTTVKITSDLVNNKYDTKIPVLSVHDKLSENLMEIQKRLKEVEEEKKIRSEEERISQWKNQGLEKIFEILSKPNLQLKDLAREILREVVDLMHSIEAGFFILEEDSGEKYLKLIASYAYNKERNIEMKVALGSGLIGRIAIEKQTLLLTEIPETYYSVNSALGEIKPSTLVIVPLININEIVGIIELASVEPYKEYEINFLEEISDNIASAIASIKITEQTEKLLEQSRKQAQLLEEQRKKLEQQVEEYEKIRKESEQKELELQSIFQAIEQSAYLLEIDMQGNIITINNSYAALFNKTPEYFKGKHFRVITTMKTESEDYKKLFQQLSDGKQVQITEVLNIEDKTIWLSHNFTPIKDDKGNIIKILDIAFDITETKLLEKQLRNQVKEIAKEARLIRKEERKIQKEKEEFLNKEILYKTVINTADEFLLRAEFSPDGNISFINESFRKLLNISEEDIYKSNFKNFLDIDSLQTYKKTISGLKFGKKVKQTFGFKTKEGKEFSVEAILNPIIKKQNIEKIIFVGQLIQN